MTHRVAPADRPGTLFKTHEPRRRLDLGRHPRERDEEHLSAIRQCPCAVCGRSPVEAAHIRMSAPGKPNAGIGAKPDDRDVIPLCPEHHMEQHAEGEHAFFDAYEIAPLRLARALYLASPNVEAMKLEILKVWERIDGRDE